MSEFENEPGHGHSVAAWTAVIIAILGISLLTLGYLTGMSIVTYIGAAMTLASIPLGPIMAKLGYGVSAKSKK